MMSLRFDRATTRRCVVQFLAASPLFASAGAPALAQSTSTPSRLADPMVWAPRDFDTLISDPKDALDVFDFAPARHHQDEDRIKRHSCARGCRARGQLRH